MVIAQVQNQLLPLGPGNVHRNRGTNNENIWRTKFKHQYLGHFLPQIPADIVSQIAANAAQSIYMKTGFCDEHAAVTAYALAKHLKVMMFGDTAAIKKDFLLKVRKDFKDRYSESGKAAEQENIKNLIQLVIDDGVIDETADVDSAVILLMPDCLIKNSRSNSAAVHPG